MIWIIGAVVLGLLIGYISYKFQKAFLGMLFVGLPIFGMIYLRVFAPLARVSGLGNGDPISVMLALIGALPQDVQSAITIFPMAAFGGRLMTWFHAKATSKSPAEESHAERKKRILAQYGMKSLPN